VHDQCLSCHAAIDWPLRRRHHHGNIVAAVAYVARPTRDPHPQLRRRDVELLGPQFAHYLQRTAAARAGTILDVDHNLIARQVSRQRTMIPIGPSITSSALSARGDIGSFLAGLVRRGRLLQIFQPELQLIGSQLLGAAAEPMPQQARLISMRSLSFSAPSNGFSARLCCTSIANPTAPFLMSVTPQAR
jgi:hypothetical protein